METKKVIIIGWARTTVVLDTSFARTCVHKDLTYYPVEYAGKFCEEKET